VSAPYVAHVHVGEEGLHVQAYRRMLAAWSGAGDLPTPPAGAFTRDDAAQVRAFQQARSDRHAREYLRPTGSIGPLTHLALSGWADDAACRLLQQERSRRGTGARRLVADAALSVLARRRELVYSGPNRRTVGRRWQGIAEQLLPPDGPRYADCSSLATWCLWVAREHGARDPSQRDWAPGSTATMVGNGTSVGVDEAQPGALFFYAADSGARHVAIMAERVRGVPFVVSFGGEEGLAYLPWDYRRRRSGSDELTTVRDYIDEPPEA
jgi:cell wall-associated NlpC family hydrolase